MTGAATQVGAQFSTPLAGTSFGVDFNPNVDRLRVVSGSGQNLVVNPSNSAVTVQTALNPGTPAVEGAAYTNNVPGARSTQLYDIDTAADALVLQNPPGNATLATVGTGVFAGQSPTVDLPPGGDLDIVSRPGDSDLALAVLNTTISSTPATTRARLYAVSIGAGTASLIGNLPAAGADVVEDLAIAPGVATFVALTGAAPQQLVQFRADRPGDVAGTATISGLQAGETLVGIDTRPATGELYGIGSASRVYMLDAATGAASQIGSATFTPALSGARFGIDFNPAADRIRMVCDADFNGRFTPAAPITNGGLTAAGDTALAYAGGDANAGANPNHGYAGLQLAGETASKLYAVNAQGNAPGAAILVGAIGLPAGTLVDGLTVQNTDRIAFSVAGARVAEGGGSVVLTVQRSGAGGDVPAATVPFATADGTASAGADYGATAGTLSFGAGETVKSITVPIVDERLAGGAAGARPAQAVRLHGIRRGQAAGRHDGRRARGRQGRDPLKRGSRTLVTRTVALTSSCKFSQKLTYKVGGRGVLRSARTLGITARFTGSAQLLPRSAATKTVRAG